MDNTYQEISNQPQSWKQTLKITQDAWQNSTVSFDAQNLHVLFIGCGTSYYLAFSASRLFQEATGKTCLAAPASEVFLTPDTVIPNNKNVVVFAVSRSGTTSEILMAVEYLQKYHPHIQTIGVTCNSQSKLAQLTDAVIPLNHASEQSVVMTQSFTNMLLAVQVFSALIGGRTELLHELNQLPDALEISISQMAAFGHRIGSDDELSQLVYLGVGAYHGLAMEATLKLKEMTQTPCESYNTLEFRHGPISIVQAGTRVVFFGAESDSEYASDVVEDVRNVGGYAVAIVPSSVAVKFKAHVTFTLNVSLCDWSRAVLYMPIMHYIAHARAVSLGHNPDKPRNLNQVVVLNHNHNFGGC